MREPSNVHWWTTFKLCCRRLVCVQVDNGNHYSSPPQQHDNIHLTPPDFALRVQTAENENHEESGHVGGHGASMVGVSECNGLVS